MIKFEFNKIEWHIDPFSSCHEKWIAKADERGGFLGVTKEPTYKNSNSSNPPQGYSWFYITNYDEYMCASGICETQEEAMLAAEEAYKKAIISWLNEMGVIHNDN